MSKISLSIVSHGQFRLVHDLLHCLQNCCSESIHEILLTLNIPEFIPELASSFSFPVNVISNATPKGFGVNHNAAFKLATGDFFCVLNPDLLFNDNSFPALLDLADQDRVGVVAPAIIAPDGSLEDSAREFPSPSELLCKLFSGKSVVHRGYGSVLEPDWIAGMFMLFSRAVFEEMGGFDERYFLYYEDVDLCARLALKGYKRLVCTDVQVVHDARRTSRRDLHYTFMHLKSIFRFFTSDVYCKLRKKITQ